MKYMSTYDLMESARNTNEWLGATARAMASYPAFALSMNPMLPLMAAWGEVTERSFGRMVAKPDWGIRSIVGPDGQDHLVDVKPVVEKPFGNLVQFFVRRRAPMARKVLLVAPMSGHYATLLRSTVASLLPDADVYVTDWHNARDIPCQRRQVRCRGLHALSGRVHARAWARYPCDRRLPARAADAGRHGLSGRRRPRRAAAQS